MQGKHSKFGSDHAARRCIYAIQDTSNHDSTAYTITATPFGSATQVGETKRHYRCTVLTISGLKK